MKIQVFRLNSSSYQDKDFNKAEEQAINTIENVEYVNSASALDNESKYVLISNTHTDVSKLAVNLLENTVLMIHPNSGHDNLPTSFAKEVQFPIILGNQIRSNAVAEYVLSCIFKHLTPIKNHLFWDQSRKWDRKRLKDQKAVIIGYGHVGRTLYKSLSPLIDDLTVIDPNTPSSTLTPQIKTNYKDLDLNGTELLIVACDLNESTRNMIDLKFLEKLNDEVLIINPARGRVIEQKDLERFLELNPKAFAYLDVFANEPFSSSDFKGLKNVNKTSHIAGVFKDLNQDIIKFERKVIEDLMSKENFNEIYERDLL